MGYAGGNCFGVGDSAAVRASFQSEKVNLDSNWTEACVEDFDVTSGYCELEPLHDANGNLTYDGSYVYTYDGWNRLASVALALPDDTISPSDADSDPDSGPTIATIEYDGLGRRTVKAITNSGDWDNEYHYYYDGWKVAEIRNAGNDVCSQYVWGLNYIDELCMVRWQFDAGAVRQVRDYYALQDANYNVMGVVDSEGILIERYEYTPYGQRTAYSHQHLMLSDYNEDGAVNLDDFMIVQANIGSAGTHADGDGDGDGNVTLDDFILMKQEYGNKLQTGDPLLYQSSNESLLERGDISLCPVGHQGLFWDMEYGIYGNRFRTQHPVFGRFTSNDPKDQNEIGGGYHDGINRFEYVQSKPINAVDPTGLAAPGIWNAKMYLIRPTPDELKWSWNPYKDVYSYMGVYADGWFTLDSANKNCCKQLDIIQIARTIVNRAGEDLTDNGWHFDKSDGREKPLYGLATPGKILTKFNDSPGRNDYLRDPAVKHVKRFTQKFETCAVCTDGVWNKKILACISWSQDWRRAESLTTETEAFYHVTYAMEEKSETVVGYLARDGKSPLRIPPGGIAPATIKYKGVGCKTRFGGLYSTYGYTQLPW